MGQGQQGSGYGARCFVGAVMWVWALGLVLFASAAQAGDDPALSQGGCIFVPTYSHILIGDNARPFPLAVTLCLRNTSSSDEVGLVAVDYHDSAGNLLKRYVDKPKTLKALGSLSFTVAESEKQGGEGAKFLVIWQSARPVSPPIAEAVMIGTSNQQGVSFTSRGQHLPAQP